MPDNEILVEHENVERSLEKLRDELESALSGGDSPPPEDEGEGMEPGTAEAVNSSRKATRDEFDQTSKDAETGREASKDAEKVAEESVAGIAASPNEFESATETVQPSAADPGTRTPSQHSDPLAAAYRSRMDDAMRAQMQAQQAAMIQQAAMSQRPVETSVPGQVDYDNYTPGIHTANQHDMNHALNRDELAEAIYVAMEEGDIEEGSDSFEGSAPGPIDGPGTEAVIGLAQEYAAEGIPYAWGGGHGGEPGLSQGISDGGGAADAHGDYNKVGLDCSGLSRDFYYNAYGVDIGAGTAADQFNSGQSVSADEARPGDIYFPESAGRPPMHVQVYIGNGQVLEAKQSGTDVMISEMVEGGDFRRYAE